MPCEEYSGVEVRLLRVSRHAQRLGDALRESRWWCWAYQMSEKPQLA